MMNAETTLADLLMLNLHKYEEEVNTIVDKAVKEMTMEKTLQELEHTWKQMEFDRVVHSRTRSTVIAASEELIELLENDQVLKISYKIQLINLFILESTTKYDEFEIYRSFRGRSIFVANEIKPGGYCNYALAGSATRLAAS